jgi:hypothetical protein
VDAGRQAGHLSPAATISPAASKPARYGAADGDLIARPATLDAIARYYTTVVQGLSVQARDGASRAELETVITCAMAAWDTLATAPAAPTAPTAS